MHGDASLAGVLDLDPDAHMPGYGSIQPFVLHMPPSKESLSTGSPGSIPSGSVDAEATRIPVLLHVSNADVRSAPASNADSRSTRSRSIGEHHGDDDPPPEYVSTYGSQHRAL